MAESSLSTIHNNRPKISSILYWTIWTRTSQILPTNWMFQPLRICSSPIATNHYSCIELHWYRDELWVTTHFKWDMNCIIFEEYGKLIWNIADGRNHFTFILNLKPLHKFETWNLLNSKITLETHTKLN